MIGAGVIGSSVALELARGGYDVTVVEKGPGAGTGSTSASSAIIRFSYSTRDAIITSWEAATRWHDWEAHLGAVDPDGLVRYHDTGNLIFRTTGYDGAAMVELWNELGIENEILDADELQRRFPWLDIGRYYPPKTLDDPAFGDDATERLTAIYTPHGGFIDDPTLAARNLAHAARQHGAVFRFRSEVAAIERTDEAVTGVRLASGEVIEAPVVVNVGGPYSSGINRLAGVDGDMAIAHRALRQEVFTAPAPEGARLEQDSPLVADLDVGQYFRPQPGGMLLIGGSEPECDPLHWIDDPDTNSEHTTVEVWETAMMRAARRMHGFGVPAQPSGVAALYDASDDWVPIYDRSSLHGFFMACGTSGNQFKNAPLAGEFLAAIVDATMAGHDHDAEPLRFEARQTGLEIDLGAFSRRRNLTATTGTVMG